MLVNVSLYNVKYNTIQQLVITLISKYHIIVVLTYNNLIYVNTTKYNNQHDQTKMSTKKADVLIWLELGYGKITIYDDSLDFDISEIDSIYSDQTEDK